MSQARGFGVAAGLDPAVAAELAGRCEELGYTSMWANDHPAASGLETLAAFAEGSAATQLGVAVLALDRHAPADINAEIEALDLDRSRLLIGVGAGFSKRPLTRMREAHDELREAIPGVRLILASMGPKMCALAGGSYDGAFFNWMTPAFAARARTEVEAGAADAGREAPRVYGYVRTSVGADAETRLAKEEGFYRDLHDGYRNHFERLAEPPGTVGVAAENPDDADAMLSAYEALDTVVVRGLASARFDAMERVATAGMGQ
jgi:alkanesulfonate monooxygenase SsuD/methylene tetrahydromethanopterin reductase-like flavin-dependent oxidoreductase (luciferase family)